MVTQTPIIDRTKYVLVPRSSVTRTLTLSRLLLDCIPDLPSPDLENMAERLRKQVEISARALRARHREFGPSVAAGEQELDNHVDALERIRSERVGHWEEFERPIVHEIAHAQQRDGLKPGAFDYTDAIAKAREAKRIRTLLYPNGLDPFQQSYYDQAESMRTLAELIEEDGCAATLDDLVGAGFTAALHDAYGRYGGMVERRAERAKGSDVDLRQVHTELQRAIQNYLFALLATIRDEDEQNVAMVRRALRPVDAVREQNLIERGRAKDGAEPSDPEAIDELLAAEREVDEELGLVRDAGTDDPLGNA